MVGPRDRDKDYREQPEQPGAKPAPEPVKDKMAEARPPTTPEGGQWPTPAEKAKTEADKLKAEKEAEMKAAKDEAEAKKAQES
jgi:hypothetical protein